MKYDFTSVVDRHEKDSIAVSGVPGGSPKIIEDRFEVIPMWVADMNFAAPSCITDAIKARLEHPFFGYFAPRQELYDGIIRWQSMRNGVLLKKENIEFDNGVLGGVTSALNAFCSKGDKIFLHSPTYIGFSSVLSNNGFHPVLSELKKDDEGIYRMDFDDVEAKIRENHCHAAIFCSPHNPCGRVWEQWELERFSEICEKYHVFVISDEIWSDIIMPGYRHIPTQSATEYLHSHSVAFYSPTKTFNLAGFQESYRVCFNSFYKDRIDKESSLSHYNALNILSMYAHIGACSDMGMEWTDELCLTLGKNIHVMSDYLNSIDGICVTPAQGTYLLFVDCSGYCDKHQISLDDLLQRCWDVGLAVQDGRAFHGPCHIRMNLALPESKISEAISRFGKFVFL